MKKKTKLIISALSVLFVTALVIGTVAYFSKSFASDGNTAYAASFDVDVINTDGTTIGDGQFNLGDELYPGMDPIEAYSFEINKNNTELPVEYQVNLTPSGDLFPQDGNSPILVTMQQKINDDWVEIDYTKTFKPENDTEAFKVFVEWPHGENDIDFQGLTGNFHLEVIATQVDPEKIIYTGDIEFKSTVLYDVIRVTSNKEIEFYIDDEGFKVINVYMGNETGDFEEKVGNFTIQEVYDRGPSTFGVFYRVITEHDYYAGDIVPWRADDQSIDTSVEGTLRFNKVDGQGRYLSIESDELYEWFLN